VRSSVRSRPRAADGEPSEPGERAEEAVVPCLERREVQLPERPLADFGVDRRAVGLPVVGDEVLRLRQRAPGLDPWTTPAPTDATSSGSSPKCSNPRPQRGSPRWFNPGTSTPSNPAARASPASAAPNRSASAGSKDAASATDTGYAVDRPARTPVGPSVSESSGIPSRPTPETHPVARLGVDAAADEPELLLAGEPGEQVVDDGRGRVGGR
jgi:hypothetical protein